MKKEPFFTIVTPTLNSEKYLEECIKSVENQSFTDWEHVFIDSYSTDKTMQIIKSYKKRHPKKVFVYQYPKAGISDAFNKGIHNSKGKYINFLGSDDLLEKEALKIIYYKMKDERYSWCYGNFSIIDANNNLIKKKKYSIERFGYLSLLLYFYICHQSVFMRRDLFYKHGLFKINLKYVMDYEFWLRISKKERPIFINKNICFFRLDGKNVSSNLAEQEKEKNMVIIGKLGDSKGNLIVLIRKIIKRSFKLLSYFLTIL